MDELVQKVEELAATTAEFKRTNDERLATIEATGKESVIQTEKLGAIEAELIRLEDSITKLNRTSAGTTADAKDAKTEAFFAGIRMGLSPDMPSEIKMGMTVANDTTGGYLASPEYLSTIMRNINEYSDVRGLVTVKPTTKKEISWPTRTQGTVARFVGETELRTESQNPLYGRDKILTREMYAIIDVSNEDLEDSDYDLEGMIRDEITESFTLLEGTSVVSGTGINGAPFGFMNAAGIAEVVSGAATTIPSADPLISLMYNIKDVYQRNGVWAFNRSTLSAIRKLKDGNNQYLWAPGIAGAIPNTILDRPYIIVPDMPSIGAGLYPVVFGDLKRGYWLVDRTQLTFTRDIYTQATSGYVRILARKRIGGNVVRAEAFAKLKIAAS